MPKEEYSVPADPFPVITAETISGNDLLEMFLGKNRLEV